MKYQVLVEFEDPVEGRLPAESMLKIIEKIRANTDGRVVWVQRLDAIWCDECNAYHDGDRERLVD